VRGLSKNREADGMMNVSSRIEPRSLKEHCYRRQKNQTRSIINFDRT
jgi:hypothetical protein